MLSERGGIALDQRTIQTLFTLLRSAICGEKLADAEKALYSDEQRLDLIQISQKHDVVHLLALGLKQNSLILKKDDEIAKHIFRAVYRHEHLNYEYVQVCSALESAKIPFVPLKGSVLRKYYPEAWMRTSCDLDILVHREDLEAAISCLENKIQFVEKERTVKDVSLYSPRGNHIELHFDLMGEGRANNAIGVLRSVWEDVSLHENSSYWYEMSDAFFYFYHIAHMAKHFENGGCGIRPFIDLWILDHMDEADQSKRDELLSKGGLLQFTNAARKLSNVWFGGEEPDTLSLKMQDFILCGGVYGSSDNRVALQQKKRGGRIGYLFSRLFIPYEKLKRYYPVLERHRWLTAFMQVRRWFMLSNPDVAKMAKREMVVNRSIEKAKADEMNAFLDAIGLC